MRNSNSESRKRRTRFLVGFDTEDDGNGNPFLFCFTTSTGRMHFTTKHDALAYVERTAAECKARGEIAEIWASNLEYDLLNLFPRDRLREIRLNFGRSVLCGATWRGAQFRDTMRHIPASVADLGALVGLPKMEGDLFEPGQERTVERFLRRCQRDAAITYRAASRFRRAYEEFGQSPRMTLASTALSIWQSSHWKRPVHRPRREVWNAAFHAYHGGRTEAFAVGMFSDVSVIDVASMFPSCMVGDDLPLPWGLYSRTRGEQTIEGLGLYEVTVSSELDLPRLPVRTVAGTFFPNGTWRAWYVGEELQAFQAAGGRIERVHRGIVFRETCRPFDSYVETMFRRKQEARGIDRTMFKLLLNALYGKFGQRGAIQRAVTVDEFLNLEHRPEQAREWNGLILYATDGAPPPWSNMVWPAFVTARARVKLASEIQALREAGAQILYCDTDSVAYVGPGKYPKRAPKIGSFEARGTYSRMLLLGKKEYALETDPGTWECHVKGVPEPERFSYLQTGEATFQRPTRLRESARANVAPNVWRTVSKVRRTIVRSPNRSGLLPTPRVGERGIIQTERR